MYKKHHILFLMIICGLSSCAPSSVREARSTISQADNMWRAGQPCDDSLQLAQAYATLDRWQWFYADDYAHACYHYGRLLRQKDDPLSAMQVFINAIHSRTHDYHILGRVYSNVGEFAHLAEEFALSYDMFEQSATMFLQNGDTLLHYYGLNNMAFELAIQGRKGETSALLDSIAVLCSCKEYLCKLYETKAEMYEKAGQYDSAVYFSKLLYENGNHELTGLLIRAQAYSHMGNKDSAVYYANYILSYSHDSRMLNSALYILTHDDDSKTREDVRSVSADRSDVQKLIEIRKAKLSQAVQLLEQDLNRKPNLAWLYAIIVTTVLLGSGFYWRSRVRKRQMQGHFEQIAERQVSAITQSIKQHIDTTDLAHTLHWKNYSAMRADADLYMGGIASKLDANNLNETEVRFCILTMLEFSLAQIAETIHYGYPSGIKTLKKRISVKLGTTPQNLRDFLFQMAIGM